MRNRTALVVGATGLVGGEVLRMLLDDESYGTVTVLTRRPLEQKRLKLVEAIVDFDRPETYEPHLSVDHVFCCLGTTIKKAGSQEAFRKVDYEYPYEIARRCASAEQFLIVTALGADASSRIFYNRVKGEIEEALKKLAFRRGLQIFRPSLLLGDRQEARPGEAVASAVMKGLGFLLAGGLKKYRGVDAEVVARAMITVAKRDPEGVHVYESDTIQSLGRR